MASWFLTLEVHHLHLRLGIMPIIVIWCVYLFTRELDRWILLALHEASETSQRSCQGTHQYVGFDIDGHLPDLKGQDGKMQRDFGMSIVVWLFFSWQAEYLPYRLFPERATEYSLSILTCSKEYFLGVDQTGDARRLKHEKPLHLTSPEAGRGGFSGLHFPGFKRQIIAISTGGSEDRGTAA